MFWGGFRLNILDLYLFIIFLDVFIFYSRNMSIKQSDGRDSLASRRTMMGWMSGGFLSLFLFSVEEVKKPLDVFVFEEQHMPQQL